MSSAISFLGSLSYVPAVLAGMMIACGRSARKPLFFLRAVVIALALTVIRYYANVYLIGVPIENALLRSLTFSSLSILTCVLCAFSLLLLYNESSGWKLLFCGITGFCLQFLTRKVYELAELFIPFTKAQETIFVLAVTAVCYAVAWRLFFRRIDVDAMLRPHRMQPAIAVIAVYVNLFVRISAQQMSATLGLKMMNWLLSVAGVGALLMLEISIFSYHSVQTERDVLLQLMNHQREQYRIEKRNIDSINIKMHDMRHMLREKASGAMDQAALEELAQQISIYDTQIKTGNDALNVVLARYMMYCERHGIRMTCMLDGGMLDFIPAHKLYAMFGNAIENAVKAVRPLPHEKRLISISQQLNGDLMNIRISNYFQGQLQWEDGLPTNIEENHGYGVKSIRMIAEEYGGHVHVQTIQDLFILNILLPLTQPHQAA